MAPVQNKLHGLYRVTIGWRRCFPPYRTITIESLETLDTLTDHFGFFPSKASAVEWALKRVRDFYARKIRRRYQAKTLRALERNKRYADMVAWRTKASTGRTAWKFDMEVPKKLPRVPRPSKPKQPDTSYLDLVMV